jgi:DNA-binding protein Fis
MSTTTTERLSSGILEFDREFERLPLSFSSDSGRSRLAEGSRERHAIDHDFATFVDDQLQRGTSGLYADAVAWMERRLLVRVLCETNGNKSKACQILGITRGSLRHKICQLGISIHQTVSVYKTRDPFSAQ